MAVDRDIEEVVHPRYPHVLTAIDDLGIVDKKVVDTRKIKSKMKS